MESSRSRIDTVNRKLCERRILTRSNVGAGTHAPRVAGASLNVLLGSSPRGPLGGFLWLTALAAALTSAGCEVFSLDGLSGADGGYVVLGDADGGTHGGASSSSSSGAGSSSGGHGGGSSSGGSSGASPIGDSGVPGDAASDAPQGSADAGADGGAPPADAGTSQEAGPLGLCAGGCVPCGATITETLAALPTAWTLNGSAFYNSYAPSAELTPIANYQAGTFIYANPVVIDELDAEFDFRLGLQGGTRADGIGFMLEQSGPTAVGGTGGGLGMAGLTGFGVEIDIHDNGVCGDDGNDHVGVDDLTVCNANDGTPTSLYASPDLSAVVDLGDAHWHHASVTLAQGMISVSIDGTQVVAAIPVPGFHAGQPYYLGFAGGTGGLVPSGGGNGGYRQEVRNVVITFPTPRCL